MIDPKHKVRNKMMKLGQLNMKYHLFEFRLYGTKANYIKLLFMKNKGDIAAVVYSPNYMGEYLGLIEEEKLVCPQCGVEFKKTSKQKIGH